MGRECGKATRVACLERVGGRWEAEGASKAIYRGPNWRRTPAKRETVLVLALGAGAAAAAVAAGALVCSVSTSWWAGPVLYSNNIAFEKPLTHTKMLSLLSCFVRMVNLRVRV